MTASRRTLGIGVVGFGWMGKAHSRSYLRIPSLYPDRLADPVLVTCADSDATRREQAVSAFGFAEATDDWRVVAEHPDVDVVVVTAPNMLHVDVVSAAAAAGKAVFCEKPVGGTPEQTVEAERAARRVVTGVGYNYRWAPLVQHAEAVIRAGGIGEITNHRGRFLSCYGNDPLGVLSWRFLHDEAGHGVSTDLLSHAVDLAMFLVGPIVEVVGIGETFISQRPLPRSTGSHYDIGSGDDPTGDVTNEDWFGAMVRFDSGAVGTFEASRSLTGPESQHAFDVYGTTGAMSWNFERMNELQIHVAGDAAASGYRTVFGGEQFPDHGAFVPGRANTIGFEDLVTIEDRHFADAVVEGRPFDPGLDAAVRYVSVQDALMRSWHSRSWERVHDLRER